jgi:hypothetical protein
MMDGVLTGLIWGAFQDTPEGWLASTASLSQRTFVNTLSTSLKSAAEARAYC